MKWLAVCVCCCVGLAGAHIHSQKLRHYERSTLSLNTWLCALFSSALVGMCGVFPLVVNRWVRLDSGCKDKLAFRAVLSFAVGGLLGDVFLHLLPEAYGTSSTTDGDGGHRAGVRIGLWVLAGLLSFLVVEKAVKITQEKADDVETAVEDKTEMEISDSAAIYNRNNSNSSSTSSFLGGSSNGLARGDINGLSRRTHSDTNPGKSSGTANTVAPPDAAKKWANKDVSGYLNLVANSTDNFTHGLAIAASYVASPAVGVLTTLAILCHEIPHEIGDFAILLNSGFTLKGAAKAQMLTATGGLVGVVSGLTAEHMSNASSWLLPFTAGGFLYIALVSIVPDLLECVSLRDSLVQLLFLGLGVLIMALVTIVEKESCGYMPGHL